MIMHVVQRASRARSVSRVIVATDDERIVDAVHKHGGEARMTSPELTSGTDRVAEVAASLAEEFIVNVQGDEPLIEPSTIDAAIQPLLDDETGLVQVSSTSEPITEIEDVFNPNVVKVVSDSFGYALYFSRSPIPCVRVPDDFTLEEWLRANPNLLSIYRKHSGLYAFTADFLERFAGMQPSPLESAEQLEQLRALERGFDIRIAPVEHRSIGVDTEQDYERVKRLIEENRV